MSPISAAAQLRTYFADVIGTPKIGGSAILEKLAKLAFACVTGTTAAQDAVAYALSALFREHAEDKNERIVTGNDTYLLTASGEDVLTRAVTFIEKGGSSDEAVSIIAGLAGIAPDKLYGRSGGETAA